MKKFFNALGIIFVLFIIATVLATVGGVATLINPPEVTLKNESVLLLKLEGVIINGEKFLEDLEEPPKLKEINSPFITYVMPN